MTLSMTTLLVVLLLLHDATNLLMLMVTELPLPPEKMPTVLAPLTHTLLVLLTQPRETQELQGVDAQAAQAQRMHSGPQVV